MSEFNLRKASIKLLLAYVFAVAVFMIFPTLDLALSGLFYDPEKGFWLAGSVYVEAPRLIAWNASIAVVVLTLVASVFGIVGVRPMRRHLRQIGFVFLLYLIGPILISDTLLKRLWGRARPATVSEFGGAAEYTPFWQPGDACAHNCSFVSGEAAGVTALAITFLVAAPLARKFLGPTGQVFYAVLGIGLPLLTFANRVATGRHFLSDVTFAALIVSTVALLLYRLILAPAKR